MKNIVIDIETKITEISFSLSSTFSASKNISGIVKVTVTSPAGLVRFFLDVEPCPETGAWPELCARECAQLEYSSLLVGIQP